MPKLRPTTRKLVLLGTIGGIILIAGYFKVFLHSDLRQPIQYNHKIHIESAGMTCVDCHESVLVSASATIPRLEICTSCHSGEPISDSPEEPKLLKFVADGNEIPWQRVYSVPDHVYFSHQRHVTDGRIECATCHGNIPDFTQPVTSTFMPVMMESCMDCHRLNGVTNDCLACHR